MQWHWTLASQGHLKVGRVFQHFPSNQWKWRSFRPESPWTHRRSLQRERGSDAEVGWQGCWCIWCLEPVIKKQNETFSLKSWKQKSAKCKNKTANHQNHHYQHFHSTDFHYHHHHHHHHHFQHISIIISNPTTIHHISTIITIITTVHHISSIIITTVHHISIIIILTTTMATSADSSLSASPMDFLDSFWALL